MDQEVQCCPRFSPSGWDDKIHDWSDKKFVKDHVFTLFFAPINFGPVMKRIVGKIEKSNAEMPDMLCLSDHTSKWNMDIYLAVDREIPEAENTKLSGKFFSKVYEGDFKETDKWCKDYEKAAKQKGLDIKKWYMWYTTCPKCAKKYGKNYVVIMGQVEQINSENASE